MSEVTNEIRETINTVLDCVDYCCNRLEVSEEEQRKFFDIVEKDIIVPTLKDTIMDALNTAMYGTKSSKYPRYPSRRVDYRSLKRNREIYELDDMYFPTLEEAKEVLERLQEYASEFGQVTVGYLYELIGETSPYTAEYYGWRRIDLEDTEIPKEGGAYMLKLPNPTRLEEFT